MKPRNILIFLIAVLVCLGVLMIIFPKDGIKISKNFELHFITWDEFWNPVTNKDISSILEQNVIKEETELVEFEEIVIYDTVYIDSMPVIYRPVLISVDSNLQRLQLPNNPDSIFGDIFNTLTTLKSSGKKIHIVYYGDSQIEVDRMTDYFRMMLQNTFGGYGPGFHTGLQAFDFKQPLVVSYSANWLRYKVFPKRDTLVPHRRYGITTSFSAYKDILDTAFISEKAWIRFEKSPVGYSNVRRFDMVKLFYGHNPTDVNLNIYDGENLLFSEILPSNENLQIRKWSFDTQPDNIMFEFEGESSPEIYGYSFESHNGVIVDNISVRGSSGTFFGMLDFSLAAQIFSNLDTRLIILQFGGNVVHGDTARIEAYARNFSNQIKYLKTMSPNAAFILIGPADMSVRARNSYVTHKKVPFIVEQLRAVAMENDCAFWDMFQAMGGQNSMPSWVFHEPPLAEKDFIHFTPQGARIVAQMFYKAFIYEYNDYIKRQTIAE
jgi:lysophospholipase L1-like esterase